MKALYKQINTFLNQFDAQIHFSLIQSSFQQFQQVQQVWLVLVSVLDEFNISRNFDNNLYNGCLTNSNVYSTNNLFSI